MKITQMNILANLWITKQYELLPCYSKYKSKDRIATTLKYLHEFDSDVYILSEVEEKMLPLICSSFEGYSCIFKSNSKEFWSEWLEDREWQPNGTCIVTRYPIDDCCSFDFGDGCKCVMVYANEVVFVGVHFDTENNKYIEASLLLSVLSSMRQYTIVVSGDYNFTDVSMFIQNGYKDVVRETVDTTPLEEGKIDHTLVYSPYNVSYQGTVHPIGVEGRDLYQLANRLCDTVSTNGSDHYCTTCVIHA